MTACWRSWVVLPLLAALVAFACGDDASTASQTPPGSDGGGGTGGSSSSSGGEAGPPGSGSCTASTTLPIFEPGFGTVGFAVGPAGAFVCRDAPSSADAASRVEIYAQIGDKAWSLEHTVDGYACSISAGPKGEVAVTAYTESGLALLRRGTGSWTSESLTDVPSRSTPVTIAFGADESVHLATATSPTVGVDRLLHGTRGADGGIDWVEVDRTVNSFGVLDNLALSLTSSGEPHFLYRHSTREGQEETLKHAEPSGDGGFASSILPLGGREDGRRTSMVLTATGEVHVSAYFESQFDEAIVHFERDGGAWVAADVKRHKHAAGELLGPTRIGIDSKNRLRVIYSDLDEGGVILATRDGNAWTRTPILALPDGDGGDRAELLGAAIGPDDRAHLVVAEANRARVVHVASCPLP